jgi:hypothetical protein
VRSKPMNATSLIVVILIVLLVLLLLGVVR